MGLLLLHEDRELVFVHIFTCVMEVEEIKDNTSLLKKVVSIQQSVATSPGNQHPVNISGLSDAVGFCALTRSANAPQIFQRYSKMPVTQEIPLLHLCSDFQNIVWPSLEEPFFHLNI